MKFLVTSLVLWLMILTAQAQMLSGDKLNYPTGFDLEANKGKTFLAMMFEKIKPAVDLYATKGFTIADEESIARLFRPASAPANSGLVSDKVASAALKAAGNLKNLLQISANLNRSGKTFTLYTLPNAIAAASPGGRVDRFKLSTFLALASGGGVAVKINDKNYFYNVNYGTGKVEKDVQTGRSFGATPLRSADDASDADYLKHLEEYISETKDPSVLYRVIIEMLLASDARGYAKLSPLGQHIATDFLAVFTAEQTRKLMEFQNSPYKKGFWDKAKTWDRALLEVSLISAFHAGQNKLQVMFNGLLTDTTLKQQQGGTLRNKFQKATLVDYWQFSQSPCEGQRNRSGINITKDEFAKLGVEISEFERKANPLAVKRLEALLGNQKEKNIFRQLSNFIINLKTPKQLGPKAYQVAEAFTQFLIVVKKDANAISNGIAAKQGGVKVEPIQPKDPSMCKENIEARRAAEDEGRETEVAAVVGF